MASIPSLELAVMADTAGRCKGTKNPAEAVSADISDSVACYKPPAGLNTVLSSLVCPLRGFECWPYLWAKYLVLYTRAHVSLCEVFTAINLKKAKSVASKTLEEMEQKNVRFFLLHFAAAALVCPYVNVDVDVGWSLLNVGE